MAVENIVWYVAIVTATTYFAIQKRVKYISGFIYMITGAGMMLLDTISGAAQHETDVGALFGGIMIIIGFISIFLDIMNLGR